MTEIKKKKIREFLQSFWKSKNAMIGLILIVLVVLVAVFASQIAPFHYAQMDMQHLLETPSKAHIFGTDNFGRDVFSRVVYGTRISLLVGIAVVGISLAVGVPLGLLAGYYGRFWEGAIMRTVDVMLAFPWVLVAIIAAAIMGAGLQIVIISLAIAYTPTFIRMIRSVVLTVRELEYVEAAKVIGENDASILFRYILPNCMAPLIVQASNVMACVILGEAAISYLGMGVQSPTPSWGIMLSEGAGFLWASPYLSVFPAIAVIITVLAINFFGDGLRDILDPKYTSGV